MSTDGGGGRAMVLLRDVAGVNKEGRYRDGRQEIPSEMSKQFGREDVLGRGVRGGKVVDGGHRRRVRGEAPFPTMKSQRPERVEQHWTPLRGEAESMECRPIVIVQKGIEQHQETDQTRVVDV